MNKRILVIFVGGTICTTVKNGEMNTDEKAAVALVDFYNRSNSFCKSETELVSRKPLNILSENMTADKWNEIIAEFKNALNGEACYDGIIVAHGTDTLAYSTALFSILLKGLKAPVIFVSSNRSIVNENGTKNENANGVDNFKYAVECIYKGIDSGVYAVYKNTEDGKIYLHKGENLIQCAVYDDNFYSRDAVDITHIEKVQLKKSKNTVNYADIPLMRMGNSPLSDCILKVNPYVGLNYDMFNLKNVKAVLHGTYHSGTACVVKTCENQDVLSNKNSILHFIDECAKLNIPFYYSPSDVNSVKTVYASVPYIKNFESNSQKAKILYGDTEELLYAKLLLAYSLDMNDKQIDNLLQKGTVR